MSDTSSFASRLRHALKTAGVTLSSPTRITNEFNLRYHGEPVSVQAVRKWLDGTATPSPDKIKTLAHWLGVSPAWLFFGEADEQEPPHSPVYDVTANFRRLSPEAQAIVRDLIETVLRRQAYTERPHTSGQPG